MDKNPIVTIELDRIRELRFGHRAMKRWSAYTGKSMSEIDTDTMGPEDVEVLMYFMLEKDAEKHGGDLTIQQMEDLLDEIPLGIMYQKLGEAMNAAFPEQAAKTQNAKKNTERAAVGTGTST